MNNEQYLKSLKIRRDAIADGIELVADDCTMTGMKHTTCTWGAHEHRDRQLHRCPMDMRKTSELSHQGCFYSCCLFQRKYKTPNMHKAVELYNGVITELEETIKNESNRDRPVDE